MAIDPNVIKTANEKSRRLKALLQAPEIVIMPGAFNVLSALLYQHLGFEAIQGSSAGFANAMGYADLGISRDTTVAVTQPLRRTPCASPSTLTARTATAAPTTSARQCAPSWRRARPG